MPDRDKAGKVAEVVLRLITAAFPVARWIPGRSES
jgi:hypothetical protein